MTDGPERGELFVVSAPSGSGKTTLCRAVCERLAGLLYSVSYTTRAPRASERHGRDYLFVSEKAFGDLVREGKLLEYAQVYRHQYGTSKEWVEQRLAEGWDVIMDVDVHGAEQIRNSSFPSHSIFILPPSWEVLRERLRSRGTDSPGEMALRLEWACKELGAWERSQFVILNEDLDEAIRALESVLTAQRCRTQRRKHWIERQLHRWTPPNE